jgi:hypothetical protein
MTLWYILIERFQVYLIARRETEENEEKKDGKCLSSNDNRKGKSVNVWFI